MVTAELQYNGRLTIYLAALLPRQVVSCPVLLRGCVDAVGVALLDRGGTDKRGELLRPTFTFAVGAAWPRAYKNKRTPSWTDRILARDLHFAFESATKREAWEGEFERQRGATSDTAAALVGFAYTALYACEAPRATPDASCIASLQVFCRSVPRVVASDHEPVVALFRPAVAPGPLAAPPGRRASLHRSLVAVADKALFPILAAANAVAVHKETQGDARTRARPVALTEADRRLVRGEVRGTQHGFCVAGESGLTYSLNGDRSCDLICAALCALQFVCEGWMLKRRSSPHAFGPAFKSRYCRLFGDRLEFGRLTSSGGCPPILIAHRVAAWRLTSNRVVCDTGRGAGASGRFTARAQ